jgi:hypothetical protein
MSVYRKFAPELTNPSEVWSDVHASRVAAPSTKPAASETSSSAHAHLRKAAPANIALPRTREWIERLPSEVRPVALMRQFARIGNLIAASWDDLTAFDKYMQSLLTDKRGNRKGFPPDVLAELVALNRHRHRAVDSGSAWADVTKRG